MDWEIESESPLSGWEPVSTEPIEPAKPVLQQPEQSEWEVESEQPIEQPGMQARKVMSYLPGAGPIAAKYAPQPVVAAVERVAYGVPRAAVYAGETFLRAARAITGGPQDLQAEGKIDEMIDRVKQWNEKYHPLTQEQREQKVIKTPWAEIKLGDIDDAMTSLGYSISNMLVTQAARIAGAAVTPGHPAVKALGGIAAGMVAGTAFTGLAMYDQFLDEARINYMTQPNASEEGWDNLREQLKSDARWYGFWEAAPETAGNLIFAGIMRAGKVGVSKVGLDKLRDKVAKSVAAKVALETGIPIAKLSTALTEELATETVTQYKQGELDFKAGLRESPPTLIEAFREVAPSVTVMTPMMALGISAAQKVQDRFKSDKTKKVPPPGADQPTDLLSGKTEPPPDIVRGRKDAELILNRVQDQIQKEVEAEVQPAVEPVVPTPVAVAPVSGAEQVGQIYGVPYEAPETARRRRMVEAAEGVYAPEAPRPEVGKEPTPYTVKEKVEQVERKGRPVYVGGAIVTPVSEKPKKERFDDFVQTLSETEKTYIKDLIKDTGMPDDQRITLAKTEILARKEKAKIQYQKDLKIAEEKTKVPTAEQIETGEYEKGELQAHGRTIVIETPKGVERIEGIPVKHPVGEIKGTVGKDGDPLDAIMGPEGDTTSIFVVDHMVNGKFDEHKVMMGFKTREQARIAHRTTYGKTATSGRIIEMTREEFDRWVSKGDKSKSVAEAPPISENQWLSNPEMRPPGYSTKKFLPGAKGPVAQITNRTILAEYRQWLKNRGYTKPAPTLAYEKEVKAKHKDTRHVAIRYMEAAILNVKKRIMEKQGPIGTTPNAFKDVKRGMFEEHTDLNADQKLATWLAKLVGVDMAFYKGPRLNMSGVFVAGPNVIAINADTEKPAIFVLLHEVTHNMRVEDWKTYQDLKWYLWNTRIKEDYDLFASLLNEQRISEGQEPYETNPYRKGTREEISKRPPDEQLDAFDEYIAESMGHQGFKEEFWNKLQKKNPTLFGQFLAYLAKAFAKIKSMISATGTQDLNYFYDMEGQVLDKMVDAIDSFAKRKIRAPMGETVKAAAIMTSDKRVFLGLSHSDAWEKAREAGADLKNPLVEGFITSRGRFVDRADAMKIAKAADQVKETIGLAGLVSEDMKWDRKKHSIDPQFQIDFDDKINLNKSFKSYSEASDNIGENAKNILVRPGKKQGKYLFVQISSSGDRASGVVANTKEGIGDEYFNKLYNTREGYVRPADFWEIPEWVGMAAKTFSNSDFYVVRNLGEAKAFLDQAKYKSVMFSVMDANKGIVKDIVSNYKGNVIASGYIRKNFFSDNPNVTWVDSIEDAAKKLKVKYKRGVNYKHFVGVETIPRLELSRGCLHNCAFCVVPKDIIEANDEFIEEQIKSFKGLKFKLIYLNDKTFGQAKNYSKLFDIFDRVKKQNPDFQGFIIQTTAPAFLRLEENFLKMSGIKYVELGVETYNDDILKNLRKPHTTQLIDKAVDKIRKLNLNFVPNIIVGLAGVKDGKLWTETSRTYQNTIDFLKKNSDIISHINAYVLATYEGTTIAGQLGVESEQDADENIIEKSWLKNKDIHEKFYKDLIDFGKQSLDKTIGERQFQIDYISNIPIQAKMSKSQQDKIRDNGSIGTPLGNKLKWLVPEMVSDIVYSGSKKEPHLQVRDYLKVHKEWRGFKITPAVIDTFPRVVSQYLSGNKILHFENKKEYDEVKKFRDDIASGLIEYDSPEYNRMIEKYGKKLQLHTVRHTERFKFSKTQIYGPVDAVDIKKTVTKVHPIDGEFTVDVYTDPATGAEVIDGPILPTSRPARIQVLKDLMVKFKQYWSWYDDWNKFMSKFEGKGISREMIIKYIKIQAVLSAQKGPQGNQLEFASAVNILQEAGELTAGEREAGGSGVSGADVYKINNIWKGIDTEVTFDDYVNAYGPKVGAYMWTGLHPMQGDAVVIDRHMPKMWGYNIMWSPKGWDFDRLGLAPEIAAEVAGDILEASRQLGISAGAGQASLWYAIRKADVEASSYRQAAQIQPDVYLPNVLFTETIPEMVGPAVHYKKALVQDGDWVYAATADGKIKYNDYSKNDIGRRIDASTAKIPYAELVYAYEAAKDFKPEPHVEFGRQPHILDLTVSRIYDAINDPLGYWDTANDQVKKDSEQWPGMQDAAAVNAMAGLIERTGIYDGFLYKQNKNRVVALFHKAAVSQAPEAITLSVSDVVERVEKIPQSISEIEGLLPSRKSGMDKGLKTLEKRIKTFKVNTIDATIARFGDVTSGLFEIGAIVRGHGPVNSAKAFGAIWGLVKSQNFIKFLRAPKKNEPATGDTWTIPVKKEYEKPSDLVDAIKRHAIENLNIGIRQATGRLFIEQYFDHEGEFAPTSGDIQRFSNFLADVGQPGSTVEVSPTVGENLTSDTYRQNIIDYFGEREGNAIYEGAKGQGEKYIESLEKQSVGITPEVKGVQGEKPTEGPGAGEYGFWANADINVNQSNDVTATGPMFYSALKNYINSEEFFKNVGKAGAPPKKIKMLLIQAMKSKAKPFKQEEWDWSLLSTWLDLQPDNKKITIQELSDAHSQNALEFNEQWRTSASDQEIVDDEDFYSEYSDWLMDRFYEDALSAERQRFSVIEIPMVDEFKDNKYFDFETLRDLYHEHALSYVDNHVATSGTSFQDPAKFRDTVRKVINPIYTVFRQEMDEAKNPQEIREAMSAFEERIKRSIPQFYKEYWAMDWTEEEDIAFNLIDAIEEDWDERYMVVEVGFTQRDYLHLGLNFEDDVYKNEADAYARIDSEAEKTIEDVYGEDFWIDTYGSNELEREFISKTGKVRDEDDILPEPERLKNVVKLRTSWSNESYNESGGRDYREVQVIVRHPITENDELVQKIKRLQSGPSYSKSIAVMAHDLQGIRINLYQMFDISYPLGLYESLGISADFETAIQDLVVKKVNIPKKNFDDARSVLRKTIESDMKLFEKLRDMEKDSLNDLVRKSDLPWWYSVKTKVTSQYDSHVSKILENINSIESLVPEKPVATVPRPRMGWREDVHWPHDKDVLYWVRFDTRFTKKKTTKPKKGYQFEYVEARGEHEAQVRVYKDGTMIANLLPETAYELYGEEDRGKVLYIQELQSDWISRGSSKGFKSDHSIKKLDNGRYQVLSKNKPILDKSNQVTAIFETKEDARFYIENDTIPDAPLVTLYHIQAIKRMIRYAAEAGYDFIAMTTGEQQVKRWRQLAQPVGRVTYSKNGTLVAYHRQHPNMIMATHENIGVGDLRDYIGKESADELIKSEPDENGLRSVFNIKIGGEFLRKLYDKAIPRSINKIFDTEQWGHAKFVGYKYSKTKEGDILDRTPYYETLEKKPSEDSKRFQDSFNKFIMTSQKMGVHITDIYIDIDNALRSPEVAVAASHEGFEQELRAKMIAFDLARIDLEKKYDDMVSDIVDNKFKIDEVKSTIDEILKTIKRHVDDFNVYIEDALRKSKLSIARQMWMIRDKSIEEDKLTRLSLLGGMFETKANALGKDFKYRNDVSQWPIDVKQISSDEALNHIKKNNPVWVDDGSASIIRLVNHMAHPEDAVNRASIFYTADPKDSIDELRATWILPITDKMRSKSLKEGFAMFNADLKVTIPTETKKILHEKIGPAGKSIGVKVFDSLRDWRENFVTRNIDRLHPIKKWMGEGKAYMLARGIPGIASTVQALLEHGKLRFDESGAIITDTQNKGFLDWYGNLGTDGEKFFYWLVAMRAKVLKKENREFLFDDEDIKKILAWVGEKPSDSKYASWNDINVEFKEWNNNILDLAQRSGLISKEFRDYMASQGYYVPFYRVLMDEDARVKFMTTKMNPKEISASIRKLKGSDKPIGDPVENILRNWMHLVSESAQNVARRSAFNYAKKNNLIAHTDDEGNDVPLVEQVSWADTVRFKKIGKGKGAPTFITKKDGYPVLQFRAAGKNIYFRVNDEELFNALGQMNPQSFDNLIMTMFGKAKRALTFGATFGPAFRAKNFLRDTLHTFQISKGFIPLWDSIAGLWKVWTKHPDYVKFMASGMAFGGSYIREGSDFKQYVDKVVKKEGSSVLKRIISSPADAIRWWNEFGEGFENAARVQLYSKLRKRGDDHLTAAFSARDLMDFNMSGSGQAARVLISTVPFMNARIQGLYKMGRAAKENPGTFFAKSAVIAMASLALWFFNKDDDRYKELEDFEKFQWYHFWIGDVHFRIPKPFETGVLFSTSVEMAADVIKGNEELSHVFDYLAHAFLETFAFNPTPQAVRPIWEQYANKSFFTGRPIESLAMQRREPGERFDPWDSETLRLVGRKLNISPKRMQHLVQGYLSTFGSFILGMSDIMTRNLADFPERPTKRIDDYPFVGAFLRQGDNPRYTKYMTSFFDLYRNANQYVATVTNARRTGDVKRATELAVKYKNEIAMSKRLNRVYKQLSDISAEMKKVWYSDMTPDQKKNRLDVLTQQRNNLVRQVLNDYQKGD